MANTTLTKNPRTLVVADEAARLKSLGFVSVSMAEIVLWRTVTVTDVSIALRGD